MPSSPPKKLRRMKELEETSSPMPSVIMEKTRPPRRDTSGPNRKPKARPPNPPTGTNAGSGKPKPASTAALSAWIATNPPRP